MYLVVYDISDDKLRTRLSKFLMRFGRRLQFSVFEIRNSERILDNIRTELKLKFEKKFTQGDSVMIMRVDDNAICDHFGYAKNEETDFLFFD